MNKPNKSYPIELAVSAILGILGMLFMGVVAYYHWKNDKGIFQILYPATFVVLFGVGTFILVHMLLMFNRITLRELFGVTNELQNKQEEEKGKACSYAPDPSRRARKIAKRKSTE